MQTRFRHLGRSRSARWRPVLHGAARERGVAGVGVGTVAAGRGRARTLEECDRQPVLAGVTSRPWVNWPISVQGGTCGASRARTVTAAAANAVNASPRRVDSCSQGGQDLAARAGGHPAVLPPFTRQHPCPAGVTTRTTATRKGNHMIIEAGQVAVVTGRRKG
jgi:hypothetical protein